MNLKQKYLARITGATAVLAGGFGMFYNVSSLLAFMQRHEQLVEGQEALFFYPAYIVMSAVCVACYVALIIVGIDLLRLRLRWAGLLTGILVFEVVYFLTVAVSWLMPVVGLNIAAATGIANGGLVPQLLILFPFWAPLALAHAAKTPANDVAAIS